MESDDENGGDGDYKFVAFFLMMKTNYAFLNEESWPIDYNVKPCLMFNKKEYLNK